MSALPEAYLHQLAGTPLLTREGEVAIAKRIERGEREILRALVDSPIADDAGTARSSRRARWRGSPDARRRAIGRVQALAVELARADADLRECERRAGVPAAELGRLLGRARRSPAEAQKVARKLGLTRARLAKLAATVENAERRIATLERAGGPVAAQRRTSRRLAEGVRLADQARAEMVRANLRLVVATARPYLHRGVSFFDLVQEGNLGLMKGIEKFDYRRGFKLCTYASWWIRLAMWRAVTEQTRTIRLPLNVHGELSRVARAAHDLERACGRTPTSDEIAGRLAISAAKVQRVLAVVKEPVPLETPLGPDGGTLEELVEDRRAASPADALFAGEVVDRTRSALSVLTTREAKILRLRFGIGGGDEQTLEQISRGFGLTRERIRQLEASAFAKLRRRHAVELRPLLEA